MSISEKTGLPLSTKFLVTSGPLSGENKLHSSAKPSIHTLVSDLLTSSAIPTSGTREGVSYIRLLAIALHALLDLFSLSQHTHTHSQDDNGNIMTIIITATSVSGVILIITIGTEVILVIY